MLEAHALRFRFDAARPLVEDVSLRIAPGEVVGVSGASGSGKTTLARLLAGHLQPQGGTVTIDGAPPETQGFRPVQYVSQNPVLAMNPRWRIGAILREGCEPDTGLRRLLGVEASWDRRFPHELSGGQLQRVALLRVLAPATRYLVLDEITSALDPLAQAGVWRTLLALSAERRIGMLAISHDAALLRRVAGRRIDAPAAAQASSAPQKRWMRVQASSRSSSEVA